MTKPPTRPESPILWSIPSSGEPAAKALPSSPAIWTNSFRKEEIVLHATVLKEDLQRAARLLFELATESTFPDREVETERGVVLDEIISYKDNPAEDVYDRFESLLFEGTPLETPILGTAATVKKITPNMLRSFVAQKFVPGKMVFTMVADLPEARMEKMVLKLTENAFSQSHR